MMDKMVLTEIYRVFHPTAADYTFFSVEHDTFSKIDHIIGDKVNLNKYKKLKNHLNPDKAYCNKFGNQSQRKITKNIQI
jgi:hypothetical protein